MVYFVITYPYLGSKKLLLFLSKRVTKSYTAQTTLVNTVGPHILQVTDGGNIFKVVDTNKIKVSSLTWQSHSPGVMFTQTDKVT